jgi:hypothetical protein
MDAHRLLYKTIIIFLIKGITFHLEFKYAADMVINFEARPPNAEKTIRVHDGLRSRKACH